MKRKIVQDDFFQDPPVVAKLKSKYVVLDGANRVTVLKELGMPHILVQIVDYQKPAVELKTWNHLICDPGFKEYYPEKIKRFGLKDLEHMHEFVNMYKGRFNFYRVVGENFGELAGLHKDAVCLVVFPRYRPEDIVEFVDGGRKIPTGITRHIINGRALFVNIPLSMLRTNNSLEAKNKRLKDFLSKRVETKKIRYYAEPLYIFDE